MIEHESTTTSGPAPKLDSEQQLIIKTSRHAVGNPNTLRFHLPGSLSVQTANPYQMAQLAGTEA